MTTDVWYHHPTARGLAALDQLRQRPFPEGRERSPTGESGPGFHLTRLWAGPPAWDADPADAERIREEGRAELEALVAVLSLRWGEPAEVDLTGSLERVAQGLPVRPPLDVLCAAAERLSVWQDGSRWVALGAGHGGPELPVQVLAATGEARFDPGPTWGGRAGGAGPMA
ncbi:hypothetical protein [Streptomyces pinistramenti]|uniref:hypothetical protein n=1 Tax=Streptomyces pinistramenti TaxID=2884812 RepID=UPI001D062BBB|nr:hypothetical protein [Streptomyces pinistramenti]MCB5909208.1 hypothetical protein [Streptomyces pinistramenti]